MKVDESNSKVAYYCGDVPGYGGPKLSPLEITCVFIQPENLKKTVVKPDGSLKTFLELTIPELQEELRQYGLHIPGGKKQVVRTALLYALAR